MQTIQKNIKTELAFPELAALTNKHDNSLIYIAPDMVSGLFRSKAWDDGWLINARDVLPYATSRIA